MANEPSSHESNKLSLFGATSVGVGAIVGGGILALAGVAFSTTGPSAVLAFALNGVIALLTALSFAEVASKFPESGGSYLFAKKVLSVDTAFMVGWVVWFASIVAAVLYALGFAHFALVIAEDIFRYFEQPSPKILQSDWAKTVLATIATLILTRTLNRSVSGGGAWINVTKVAVFAAVIAGGLWAIFHSPSQDVSSKLKPFFTAGGLGLLQAMGYTFIALQGFDLIAAVGGEVRKPARNIPLAMLLSLGIALAIYVPLLFVVMTVGVSEGTSISEAAAKDPEVIVALATKNFLGRFGYGLVVVAAVLSMYSALQANIYAASRIASAMAGDRNLPTSFGKIHSQWGTPVHATWLTTFVIVALLLVIPDVAAAGAASSLIFLVTFALAHWITILVRQRSLERPPPFRTPFFPLFPVVGGLACLALAIFQGIAVPTAGFIAAIWLACGILLFMTLFAKRARAMDASSTVFDPELIALRGINPLLLIPIANPSSASALCQLGAALIPPKIGRMLLLSVVEPESQIGAESLQPSKAPKLDALTPDKVDYATRMVREHLTASCQHGVQATSMTTIAESPMEEIARVARQHQCQSLLVGFGEISAAHQGTRVEWLLGALDADVVILRANDEFDLAHVRRVLVPVAGLGGHDALQARLLSSLSRIAVREVTFVRVLSNSSNQKERQRAERDLRRRADDEAGRSAKTELIIHDHACEAIVERSQDTDLLILGVQRVQRQKKLVGSFTRKLAASTPVPIIALSRRG